MRTPEQIQNLRLVMMTSIGPYAYLINDEDVNRWADKIQKQIDDIKYHWTIRITTSDIKNVDWSTIEKEEVSPYSGTRDLVKACKVVLDKYKKIQAIKITPLSLLDDSEQSSDEQVITR